MGYLLAMAYVLCAELCNFGFACREEIRGKYSPRYFFLSLVPVAHIRLATIIWSGEGEYRL